MIFRNHRSTSFAWLRTGICHGRSAGRVEGKQAIGSGFLLNGDILGERWANLPIFATARHVISEEGPIHPADASIVFEGMFDDISKSVTCSIERLLISSPAEELAYTMLLLSRWPGPVADSNIALQRPNPGDRVYIMGYPHGHGLSISLEDTEVVAVPIAQRPAVGRDEDAVYYRAPTEKGGAGSIVFNDHWEPIALQLGSSPEFGANFGVFLSPIVEDARKKLQAFQLPDDVVQRLRQSLREDDGIQYQSVFISYSHADSVFANRLYTALHMKGVRAWLDKHEMVPGQKILDQVRHAIDETNVVVLCCSKDALTSWWVDSEIERTFEKERQLSQAGSHVVTALIPINLDGYLFTWNSGSAPEIRSRFAVDFTGWQDDAKFETALNQMLRGLEAKNEGAIQKKQ